MNRHRDEDVELGEEVRLRRKGPGTVIVAVRLSPDLLREVSAYANANGMLLSEVLRLGVVRLLRPIGFTTSASTAVSETWAAQ
jgi:hypothetical protein